ncbi:AP2/ERF family transcription factor [Methylobacterium sp. ID0610]|uniref:AP2/ERF family transcription factor n=1 Tax=Methylobacterium carpenticola TaxID=3344827 RepID=UPI003682C453
MSPVSTGASSRHRRPAREALGPAAPPASILRIEDPSHGQGAGWMVTALRDGGVVTRHFADEHHGGSAGSRSEAERFAAGSAVCGREGLALMRRLRPRRNCRSGLPGVSRFVRKPSGTAFWVAYWDDAEGRKIQRKFSVSIHGEEEARRLAIEARLTAVREHIDRSVALQVGGVALTTYA